MGKDFLDIIKTVVTVLIAVVGWCVGHYFTSRRDRQNKKREICLQHLINAYRILAQEISKIKATDERLEKLALVLMDIQMFGSKQQIDMAKQLAQKIADRDENSFIKLMDSLRADLRKQLDLEKIRDNNFTLLKYGKWNDFI